MLAAIIHMGNLEIIENKNEVCALASKSRICTISNLLEIDPNNLEKILLYKVTEFGKADRIV